MPIPALPFVPRPFARVAAAALVCSTAWLGGCDKLDLTSPADRIEKARVDLAARNPKAAEIELKNALQKEPKNIDARLLLADVYLALHRGQDAEVEITHAEEYGATSRRTLLPRARAYVVQRQFGRVLRDVPVETDGDPQSRADLLEVRGDAQAELGLAKEGEASYDAALALRPGSPHAQYGRARVLAQQGRREEALQVINAAIAAAPNLVSAQLLKGEILLQLKKVDEALAVLRAAAEAAPDDQTAQITLASALIYSKDVDAAAKQIDLVVKKWPQDAKVQYLLAITRYNRGDFPAAADAMQKVMTVTPDYPPAIALSASIQYALGSFVAAEANARRFVSIYPTSVYGAKLLAAILLRENQPARAFEAIRPILASADSADSQSYAIAGAALALSGDTVHAAEYYAKASQLAPGDATLRRASGMGSLATNQPDSAITAFKSVVDIDPSNEDANMLLVLAHVGHRDFDQAIAMTKSLIEKNPQNALYANLLGGVYLAKSDAPAARKAFEKATSLRPDWAPPVINLAKLDVTDGKIDDARKRLETVANRDNRSLDVLYLLSDLESASGRPKESRRWMEMASKEYPDLLTPQRRYVAALLADGEAARAVEVARAYAARKPEDTDALVLLGSAQGAANQRDAAVATYGKLAGLRPKDAWIQVAIARLETQDGHVAAAQSALAKALALEPDSADAQTSAAEMAARFGRFDEASRYVAQLEKRPEAYATARLLAGDIAMGRRQPDVAIKAYQDALAKLDNALAIIKLHAALASVGRKQEANDRLGAWVAKHPRDLDSRIYRAGFAEVSGDVATAKRTFTEVLGIDPQNPVALNELALMAAADNDSKTALDFASRAYAQRPDDTSIADTFGWLVAQSGDAERARPILEKAVARTPGRLEVRYHLAVVLVKVGDRDAARTNLRAILSAKDSSPLKEDARKLLGSLS